MMLHARAPLSTPRINTNHVPAEKYGAFMQNVHGVWRYLNGLPCYLIDLISSPHTWDSAWTDKAHALKRAKRVRI